jgi:hypothetical protein
MEFTDHNTVPDTLVLKIVENIGTNPDTILYVLYDKSKHRYVIRGSRQETKTVKTCSYSFECKSSRDLVDFIKFLIDSSNDVSYILYNYDNLPFTSNEITYEFLSEYDNIRYEISGYDNQKLKRKELLKYLRMLRNIFNDISYI